MSRPCHAREMFKTWGRCMYNGGWDWVAPVSTNNFQSIPVSPGTHSDIVGDFIERLSTKEEAEFGIVNSVYMELSPDVRAIVFETFVEPLHMDKNQRGKYEDQIGEICRAWRITRGKYYELLEAAYTALRRRIQSLEAA